MSSLSGIRKSKSIILQQQALSATRRLRKTVLDFLRRAVVGALRNPPSELASQETHLDSCPLGGGFGGRAEAEAAAEAEAVAEVAAEAEAEAEVAAEAEAEAEVEAEAGAA